MDITTAEHFVGAGFDVNFVGPEESAPLREAAAHVGGLDSDAKEEYKTSNEELQLFNFPKDKLKSTKFYKGTPKASNHNTGYKGRTAIHEIMEINSTIRNLIYKNADQDKLFEQAKQNGMTTLREAGIGKVISGETSISVPVSSANSLATSNFSPLILY